jgi:hypothetical protein
MLSLTANMVSPNVVSYNMVSHNVIFSKNITSKEYTSLIFFIAFLDIHSGPPLLRVRKPGLYSDNHTPRLGMDVSAFECRLVCGNKYYQPA